MLARATERIYLSFNNLTGTIPPELGQLTRLGTTTGGCLFYMHVMLAFLTLCRVPPVTERLQLTTNDLTGTIPSTIGNLTDLLVLGLGHNQLRGALPSDLGNLESLSKYNKSTFEIEAPEWIHSYTLPPHLSYHTLL
jgi:Leucine-rich repeat (LRR) protein